MDDSLTFLPVFVKKKIGDDYNVLDMLGVDL
jgi:hypothetical protein